MYIAEFIKHITFFLSLRLPYTRFRLYRFDSDFNYTRILDLDYTIPYIGLISNTNFFLHACIHSLYDLNRVYCLRSPQRSHSGRFWLVGLKFNPKPAHYLSYGKTLKPL